MNNNKNRIPIHSDVVMSLFFITFAIVFIFNGRDLAVETTRFPYFCAGLMGFLSLFVLKNGITEMLKQKKEMEKDNAAESADDTFAWENLKTPVLAFVLILLYAISIAKIGFFVSSFVFIIAFLWLLNYRVWWKMLLTAVVLEAFVYFIFVVQLNLVFPNALLF